MLAGWTRARVRSPSWPGRIEYAGAARRATTATDVGTRSSTRRRSSYLLRYVDDPAATLRRSWCASSSRALVGLPARAHVPAAAAHAARLLRDAGLEPVVDVGLWRTFTLGYWTSGLGERSGALGAALARLRATAARARAADDLARRRARDGRAPRRRRAGGRAGGGRPRGGHGLSAVAERAAVGRPPRRGEHAARPRRAAGRCCCSGSSSIAITTRYLGPDRYGRFALALSFVQLFGVLADAGLTTIVVRELAQKPERAASVLGSALALRSGLAIAAAAAAALVALAMPYPPDVRIAVLIAGVPLVLGLLNSAFVAVLQSDLRAGRIAIADVGGPRRRARRRRARGGARPRLLRRRGRRGRGRGGDAGADLGARAPAACRRGRRPTARRCGGCSSPRCRSAPRSRSTRRTSAPTR